MSDQTLRVIAHVRAKPGSEDVLRALFVASLATTRAEPGCLGYTMLQSRRDPAELSFLEEWQDDAAFKLHFSLPHMQALAARLGDLAEGAPDIRKYQLVD